MNKGVSMIETLRDFVTKADALGLEYMVTGSFAMSAYGEIRFTRDIDVVLQISDDQATAFAREFERDYYISQDSVKRAIFRRSIFNVINHEYGGKLDCIVMKDTDFARASFARRYKVTVSGIEFWTTTREDLVVAKLSWARDTHSEMQIRDIANLTSTEYDSDYVAGWIERLDLRNIWSEVEAWKIQRKRIDS
jgi:hypothetical protein